MFGVLVRAAIQGVFVALIASVLSRAMDPIVQIMLDGPATQNDFLINSLETASTVRVAVLLGMVALLLKIVTAAIVESRGGI